MPEKEDELTLYRRKFIEIESEVFEIENINNLFSPFADENCPEGTIVAGLIKKHIKNLKNIINF